MKTIRFGLSIAVFSLILSGLFFSKTSALDIPIAPTLEMPIVDQTNTLTNDQKDSLAEQINSEQQKTSNEIAILMIDSLENESLEDFSISVARQWGVGSEKNNGVLLLVALNDRKVRIEVGDGLEGALTDAISSRIIRNDITPAFKDGRYYDGIHNGITSIISATHGEYKNSEVDVSDTWIGVVLFLLIVGANLFFIIIPIMSRSKRWWPGGVIGGVFGFIVGSFFETQYIYIVIIFVFVVLGLIFDKAVSKNYQAREKSGKKPSWWAGGFSGGSGSSGSSDSSSGGGGDSFGGGDFSGGGSSGSW